MNKKTTMTTLPASYVNILENLKERIRTAQVKAILSVNRELVQLYWDIGKAIVERQRTEGWGSTVVECLAEDLSREFPNVSGFSARNIWRMRAFYIAYTVEVEELSQLASEMDGKNLPQAAAEIPWFHNIVLLEKVKNPAERLWYARQTVINGWSRAVLVNQVESDLYHRQGNALSNFRVALPPTRSDLAEQTFRDPYVFDFLNLSSDARERDLENALIDNIQRFLIELGAGFAFVGRQVHIDVGGQDYYMDLLFYHLKLRCYVIVELKVAEFKPEHAGKMNFYLSAVDDLMRHPQDAPSIGLILCKEKAQVTVEYALRSASRPIGVAAYKLTRILPKKYAGALPTIEEIEQEISRKERERSEKGVGHGE